MQNAPCFGCENRAVGCHSDCARYREFETARKSEREATAAANRSSMNYCGVRKAAREKA